MHPLYRGYRRQRLNQLERYSHQFPPQLSTGHRLTRFPELGFLLRHPVNVFTTIVQVYPAKPNDGKVNGGVGKLVPGVVARIVVMLLSVNS